MYLGIFEPFSMDASLHGFRKVCWGCRGSTGSTLQQYSVNAIQTQIVANIVDCKEHIWSVIQVVKNLLAMWNVRNNTMGHTINLDGFAVNMDEQFFVQLFL